MKHEKIVKLFKAVKSGQLVVNERNANAVKCAYLESSLMKAFFSGAFLSRLPDPGGAYTEAPSAFEKWLVDAYSKNFKNRAECRKAVRGVVKQAIKEYGL